MPTEKGHNVILGLQWAMRSLVTAFRCVQRSLHTWYVVHVDRHLLSCPSKMECNVSGSGSPAGGGIQRGPEQDTRSPGSFSFRSHLIEADVSHALDELPVLRTRRG